MNAALQLAFLFGLAANPALNAQTVLFQDDFAAPSLDSGWTWSRENPAAWRISRQALEIRVQPGNLWGGANNARNILARPLPDTGGQPLEVAVTVENRPAGQYEQANLAWYYDDAHMVKLGQELVDGKLCVVMGREFGDKARTLGIHPLNADRVHLRLRIEGNQIRGEFRPAGSAAWQPAGAGDLPAPPDGVAKVSLHCYQGLLEAEHWVRFSEFRIVRGEN